MRVNIPLSQGLTYFKSSSACRLVSALASSVAWIRPRKSDIFARGYTRGIKTLGTKNYGVATKVRECLGSSSGGIELGGVEQSEVGSMGMVKIEGRSEVLFGRRIGSKNL